MPPDPPFRAATADQITDALAHALRYDGRRQHRQADGMMARIVAEHLLRHLEASGFVVIKRPASEPHRAPAYGPGGPAG